MTTATTTIDRQEWRIEDDGGVSRRPPRGEWERLTRTQLLAIEADGPVWTWLRSRGVRRPSPAGKRGGVTPNAERRRAGGRRVEVWLTEDENDALERRREGRSVRDTIGALLLAKQ